MNRPSDLSVKEATERGESRARAAVERFGQWLRWSRPGVFSGLLLWMSFPPVGWSWLAWVALVPLATLVRTPWRSQPIYRPAWLGGLVFGLLAVQWIRYADDTGLTGYYGWFALAFYLSLYFPLFVLATRVAVLRFRVPAIVAVPVVWVGLEYMRSWMISGFPWYYLGHTQHWWLSLIQIADLAGAYGVSFVVALANGWLVDVLSVPLLRPGPSGARPAREQVWRLTVVVAAVVGTVVYGRARLAHPAFDLGPRVALVQTNLAQKVKVDETQVKLIDAEFEQLLREAGDAEADLIVWPETSFRHWLLSFDRDVTDDDLRTLYPGEDIDPAKVRAYPAKVRASLISAAEQARAPMLVGLNAELISRTTTRVYNSAVLVTPAGHIAPPYHKIHRVPWGEYLPLRDYFPWLRVLTPHASANYGLDAGSEPVRIRLDGYSLGVLICFEDTLPGAARTYMQGDPVDMLVNISNDGWFAGSSELDVHLAISVFRAVECRRPLVRAVNTGISAIIDSDGRIVHVAGAKSEQRKMSREVVAGQVPLDHRDSFYVRTGDWLGIGTQIGTAIVLVAGFGMAATRRRQRAASPLDS